MSKGRLLLVYPKMGMTGVLVKHLPLSLLYASIDSIKYGFEIDLVDVRLSPQRWEAAIRAKMTPETLLVGVSVMTGDPIRSALDVSRWIRREYPTVKVVWGGPHVTFSVAETLSEPSIDYAIASYGSRSMAMLAEHICAGGRDSAQSLSHIPGLVFRDDQRIVANPPVQGFEFADYRDIPYHLIEGDLNRYGQLDSSARIFPLYSVMGCPYHCAFCSSPAQYRRFARKYECLSPKEVADHITLVHCKYGATYIYFIDDDSFVKLDHVEAVIDEINRRGIKVGLGFRGARINEIKMMSDGYLAKLAAAGTNILHIGAESGSQRILDMMRKNCTVEDIVEVNRKLARHPEITAAYNWIVGLPGETMEDLHKTRDLVLRLIADNSRAIIFAPNKYRPLPGTELYSMAVAQGYARPTRLESWTDFKVEGEDFHPWVSQKAKRMINMMWATSYFIDDKLFKIGTGNTLRFRVLRLVARFYAPIARWRYRHSITALLLEYQLFRWIASRYRD